MKSFGTVVREARLERELTLEKVAKRIGSHKGYISSIENGTVAPPSIKILPKLARVLEIPTQELLALAWWDKRPKLLTIEAAHALILKVHGESRPCNGGRS